MAGPANPYKAETKRLWLEELNIEKHLADYHEIISNPKAMIWSSTEVKKSLEESRDRMARNIPSSERPWVDMYAILLRPTPSKFGDQPGSDKRPKMIGCIGVVRSAQVAEVQRLEFAYIINNDYWGTGYATEALGAFLDIFFSSGDLKAKQLIAKVDLENMASIRVLKKMEERGYKVKEGEVEEIDFSNRGRGLRDMRTWYINKTSDSLQ